MPHAANGQLSEDAAIFSHALYPRLIARLARVSRMAAVRGVRRSGTGECGEDNELRELYSSIDGAYSSF